MKVCWDLPVETAAWVAQRVPGCERGWTDFVAALVHDERLKVAAGVVFHDWSPENEVIEVTAAAESPHWAQRGVLRELFGYAFTHCQMVVARTTSPRVVKMWRGFGADAYEIPRLAGRGRGMTLLTLTDDAWAACRLNGGSDGKAKRAEAA